jgi:hypothetical protein
MADTSSSSIRPEKTAERDRFFKPALAVSIAIAIFAVVMQFLAAISAISLSTTQQLAVWLVAAGLVVLLWMAYMVALAQARLADALVTATTTAAQEAADARQAAREQVAQAERAAARRGRDDTVADAEFGAAEAESRDAWVPPDNLRRLDGWERTVSTADVFPDGCYLDSISETDTGGEVVDINRPRERLYRCAVVDLNRALKDRPHDTIVNILTDQEVSLQPGVRLPLVEFDGLTITPYVTNRSPVRMGYTLHATGIRPVAGQAQEAS